MLSLSTILNDAAMMNLVGYLLQRRPPKMKEAVGLMTMVRTDKMSWMFRLRIANAFLMQGQIAEAKELIAGIDMTDIISKITNAAQVMVAYHIFNRLDKNDEIVRLLGNMDIVRLLDDETVGNLKIQLVIKLALQGEKDKAAGLLSDIDLQPLLNSPLLGLLAYAYTLLGMWTEAENTFNTAEEKDLLCDDFNTFKAIGYRCSWQIELAEKYIQRQFRIHPTPRSFFWSALMAKITANNLRALKGFRQMLAMPIDMGMKSSVLTEIGNVYRSEGRYQEAVRSYNQAKKYRIYATGWRPYFEHALLLLYLDAEDEAWEIAEQGMAGAAVFENACLALQLIIKQRREGYMATPDERSALEYAGSAFCVHRYFPYAAYVNYIHAYLLWQNGRQREATEIIERDICKNSLLEPRAASGFLRCCRKHRTKQMDEMHHFLSQGLWPYHDRHSFEHQILTTILAET